MYYTEEKMFKLLCKEIENVREEQRRTLDVLEYQSRHLRAINSTLKTIACFVAGIAVMVVTRLFL